MTRKTCSHRALIQSEHTKFEEYINASKHDDKQAEVCWAPKSDLVTSDMIPPCIADSHSKCKRLVSGSG